MIVTSIWVFLFISIIRRALQHLVIFRSRSDATHISSGNDISTSNQSCANDNSGSNDNGKANALHLQSK